MPDPSLDRRRLDLARQALVDVGYFTEDEVGDDIAPRIAELMFAIRDGKFDPAEAFGHEPEPVERDDDDPVQYVVPAPVRPALENWLRGRGLGTVEMHTPRDVRTFIVGLAT